MLILVSGALAACSGSVEGDQEQLNEEPEVGISFDSTVENDTSESDGGLFVEDLADEPDVSAPEDVTPEVVPEVHEEIAEEVSDTSEVIDHVEEDFCRAEYTLMIERPQPGQGSLITVESLNQILDQNVDAIIDGTLAAIEFLQDSSAGEFLNSIEFCGDEYWDENLQQYVDDCESGVLDVTRVQDAGD
ncbi:MAG: hypothetical protein KC561_18795, partial [Myxococcales bacterium]|nr:hypothetical protein [Myxococcales bacterium]